MDGHLKEILPAIIGGVTKGGHLGINSAFLNKLREVEESGDQPLASDLKLLAAVFSMYLRFTDGKSEFAPLAENFQQSKRSMIPSDLTDSELDRLEAVLEFSDDPLWISRMADVLWLQRRNHLHAPREIRALPRLPAVHAQLLRLHAQGNPQARGGASGREHGLPDHRAILGNLFNRQNRRGGADAGAVP